MDVEYKCSERLAQLTQAASQLFQIAQALQKDRDLLRDERDAVEFRRKGFEEGMDILSGQLAACGAERIQLQQQRQECEIQKNHQIALVEACRKAGQSILDAKQDLSQDHKVLLARLVQSVEQRASLEVENADLKEEIQNQLKTILIYRPLKNALTLGLYDLIFGSSS